MSLSCPAATLRERLADPALPSSPVKRNDLLATVAKVMSSSTRITEIK